jgi:dienelactone hydrolase
MTLPRRWREQRWLLDSVIEQTGLDYDQLRRGNTVGAAGIDAGADFDLVNGAVTRFDEIGPAFADRAYRRLRRGRDAEAKGDTVAAREHYFTAAAFFGWAQWPLHDDADPRMAAWNELKLDAFSGYTRCAERTVRRVEIPFGDHTLPAWLHLPRGGEGPYPVVIVIPGMDTFKEIQIGLYGDKFLERGFATLAVDGPGQSEPLTHGLKLTATNFADAADAWLGWIEGEDALDETRVGVYGRSFGSYATTLIAAHHSDRIKGAAGALVVHEPGLGALLNEAAPSFQVRFQYMLGARNDDELDALARTFDLRPLASRITCPFLAAAGEIDQLSPTQHTVELMRQMRGHRQLLIYEQERHAIGRSLAAKNGPNWHSYIAEWMRRTVIERRTEGPESQMLFVRASGEVESTPLHDIAPGLKQVE